MLKFSWLIVIINKFGCTNHSESKKISFYQIPGEKWEKTPLKTRLLHSIKRESLLPANKIFYICAEYLEESCFERHLKVGQKQSLTDVSWRKPFPEKQTACLKNTCKGVNCLLMLEIEGLQCY